MHRRPGPPLGQRVHLPDARDAEHRDAQRHGREEDHHAVPALLQHAEERVPAARRQLRGGAPLASCSTSSSPTAGSRSPARRSTSASRTTTPATSAATTTCTSRRATSIGSLARHRHRRDAAQRHQAACAAAPAARACGWRRRIGKKVNIERSQEAIATGADAHRGRVPVLLRDDGRRREGRRARDEEVRVQDIAEILWEAIEAGERAPAPLTAEFQPGV